MRDVNFSLIFVLGTLFYLYENMISLMGNSTENHQTKNKLISRGFNLFLAAIFGFVVNFTPCGETTAKKVTQDYKEDKEMGKIDSTTLLIVGIINIFYARQQVIKYIPMAHNLESYQKL